MLCRPSLIVASIFVLGGCSSSSQDANEANFIAALQHWYDEHPECTTLAATGSVPIVRETTDRTASNKIDAAVAAGLLTVESFREVPRFGTTPIDYRRYRPTDIGRDVVVDDDRGIGGVRICFAHRKIESVKGFTEPADMAGLHVSRVTYRYGFKDIASWSANPEIQSALPAIGASLADIPGEATDTLVLTDKGWARQSSR